MAHWSLFDHAAFLLRFWVVLSIVLALCGGLGFMIRMGTSYEAEGIVRIGWVHTRGFVEPLNDVVARINTPPFVNSVLEKSADLKSVDPSSIGIKGSVPENSGLVKIESTAPTEALASQLVILAVDRLVLDHKPMMDHFRERSLQRLKEVQQLIVTHDKMLELSTLTAADRGSILERTVTLKKEATELELYTDPNVSRPTQLLEAPAIRATTPGKRTAALGAASGFALAMVGLYFLEYTRRVRANSIEKLASPANDESHANGGHVNTGEVRPAAKV